MVKRLAPVQAPPRVTVRQKDGSPTWSHDGEITFRRDAFRAVESGGWTACAGSTIGTCAGRCCSMDRDCNHRPRSARGQRRGDCFLTQTRKKHRNWRTIALLSHIGKAWAKASVHPLVAEVAGPCQFGSLPRRSTRDAVAILENVFERFTNSNHTIPRNRLLAAVSDAAKFKGLSVVLEAGHEGTCYIIRNCLG